jgi:predicted protein tyrosine phosphatase
MSANEIIPNLFLGDIVSSKSQEFIDSMKIRLVVNCTKNIPFIDGAKYKKLRVPVDDNLELDEIKNLADWGPRIIREIWKEYKQGHAILVHCHAGMQRSAAIVAMFLIFYQRLTHKEAIDKIKKRRTIAFQPKINFFDSIISFEKELNEALRRSLDGERLR